MPEGFAGETLPEGNRPTYTDLPNTTLNSPKKSTHNKTFTTQNDDQTWTYLPSTNMSHDKLDTSLRWKDFAVTVTNASSCSSIAASIDDRPGNPGEEGEAVRTAKDGVITTDEAPSCPSSSSSSAVAVPLPVQPYHHLGTSHASHLRSDKIAASDGTSSSGLDDSDLVLPGAAVASPANLSPNPGHFPVSRTPPPNSTNIHHGHSTASVHPLISPYLTHTLPTHSSPITMPMTTLPQPLMYSDFHNFPLPYSATNSSSYRTSSAFSSSSSVSSTSTNATAPVFFKNPMFMETVQEDKDSLLPPENFAMVRDGVYRCAFPDGRNFRFLKTLGLKSIITLALEPYPTSLHQFLDENNITLHNFGIPGNKEPFIDVPHEKLLQAMVVLLDKRNHPVLVHCNKGKHRTGCLIALLRRLQRWSLTSVIEEYRRFSFPKERAMDMVLIEMFDLKSIWQAVQRQFLPDWTDLQYWREEKENFTNDGRSDGKGTDGNGIDSATPITLKGIASRPISQSRTSRSNHAQMATSPAFRAVHADKTGSPQLDRSRIQMRSAKCQSRVQEVAAAKTG